jgi:UDP-3-O-[3-hydroxymyristoyl] N-acetylglucosamine deacetylase/3-hydroxyacyl-[acyl-carrier-protein] dehydratase
MRRTALKNGEVEVFTVEHVLAAVAGLGIDNLIIELDASEVPNVDGSALPFVKALQEAGITEQEGEKRVFRIGSPVAVGDGEMSVSALPDGDGLQICYTLQYDVPSIGTQHMAIAVDEETFCNEIAPARTFSPEEEVMELRELGLGKGASYETALVVSESGVVDNELRFPDEFVRHKVLDLIGDLFLLGAQVRGRIVAVKSGHSLNASLVKALKEVMVKEQRAFESTKLGVEEIMEILPHRYPFLLVDKIIYIEDDRRVVGIKNVTHDEPFFQGHFPGRPVMPGVLQIEAMAQVAGVLLLRKGEWKGKTPFLMGVDRVKFRRPVVPGDQLRLEAEVVRVRSRAGHVRTKAYVDGKLVAEAEIKFMLLD